MIFRLNLKILTFFIFYYVVVYQYFKLNFCRNIPTKIKNVGIFLQSEKRTSEMRVFGERTDEMQGRIKVLFKKQNASII